MKNSFQWIGLLFGLLIYQGAWAQGTPIRFGYPDHGGTGCPQGSVSTTLSSDGATLAILFDQYLVESGNTVGKTVDYKSCNIRIPVDIPHGWTLSVIRADYRGYNFLANRNSSAVMSLQYSFGAGNSGRRYNRTFYGPLNDSYLISDQLPVESFVTSRCGERTIFNINTSIRNVSRDGRQALTTLDSADLSSGIVYQLSWKRCP